MNSSDHKNSKFDRYPNLNKLTLGIIEHSIEPVLGKEVNAHIEGLNLNSELYEKLYDALVHTEKIFIEKNLDVEISFSLLGLNLGNSELVRIAFWKYFENPANADFSILIYRQFSIDYPFISDSIRRSAVNHYMTILNTELMSIDDGIRQKISSVALNIIQSSVENKDEVVGKDGLDQEQKPSAPASPARPPTRSMSPPASYPAPSPAPYAPSPAPSAPSAPQSAPPAPLPTPTPAPPPPAGAFPNILMDYLKKFLGPPASPLWLGEEAPEPSSRPGRVLNAGFSGTIGPELLGLDQPLIGDQNCNLLVDIGPRWREFTSLVVENRNSAFPEEFLPRDLSGYLVRVVFVSEDFTPHLVSAEMWVPAQSGQSHPYANGERSEMPGPVSLTVRAPHLKLLERVNRAYGRLCLYYKGQLIQSAQVSVGIAKKEGIKLKEPNKIEVDYVLTSNLTDISTRLDSRLVQIQSEKARPVSVGLTLNDDGSGRHRILATYHVNSHEESTVPPAWAPYDAQSAQNVLEEFRKAIASCYKGLDANFGKPRKRFGYDLLELAKIGDRLRALALSDLDVAGTGRTVALWRRELLETLKTATVIQIARTGPANYVFPWALVYDIPMPGPEYDLCKVITEWGENGIRKDGPQMACPYQEEEWHQQNIICPYGFWGLKHIIEQPPGAIHKQEDKWSFEISDKVAAKKDIEIGVGITFDIDQTARDNHINRLVNSMMQAHLEPQQPVYDRDGALKMLRAPEIVYFLCHGETDPKLIPYLSIGEHVNKPEYMIYPNTLEQWSSISRNGLDLVAWQKSRPLVFINGCHTAELQPGVVLNFVSAFADLGASGVIGTEVSVLADMAMVIAEAILRRVGNGMELGQAIREMRWEMLNRGNLLGLAYTPYSLANLHIERAL